MAKHWIYWPLSFSRKLKSEIEWALKPRNFDRSGLTHCAKFCFLHEFLKTSHKVQSHIYLIHVSEVKILVNSLRGSENAGKSFILSASFLKMHARQAANTWLLTHTWVPTRVEYWGWCSLSLPDSLPSSSLSLSPSISPSLHLASVSKE